MEIITKIYRMKLFSFYNDDNNRDSFEKKDDDRRNSCRNKSNKQKEILER